jgi:hypothetical protein
MFRVAGRRARWRPPRSRLRSLHAGQRPDVGVPLVLDRDIGGERLAARAVDDETAANEDVEDLCLRSRGCGRPANRVPADSLVQRDGFDAAQQEQVSG